MIYFDWDEAKARQNLTKHGVTFEDAAEVFDDPLHRLYVDRIVEGEERWHAIGVTDGVLLILVVHTIRQQDPADEIIRIISARRATPRERSFYELQDRSIHP